MEKVKCAAPSFFFLLLARTTKAQRDFEPMVSFLFDTDIFEYYSVFFEANI